VELIGGDEKNVAGFDGKFRVINILPAFTVFNEQDFIKVMFVGKENVQWLGHQFKPAGVKTNIFSGLVKKVGYVVSFKHMGLFIRL